MAWLREIGVQRIAALVTLLLRELCLVLTDGVRSRSCREARASSPSGGPVARQSTDTHDGQRS